MKNALHKARRFIWCRVVYSYLRPTFRPLSNAACVCVERGQNGENLLGQRLRLRRVVWPGRVSAIEQMDASYSKISNI